MFIMTTAVLRIDLHGSQITYMRKWLDGKTVVLWQALVDVIVPRRIAHLNPGFLTALDF